MASRFYPNLEASYPCTPAFSSLWDIYSTAFRRGMTLGTPANQGSNLRTVHETDGSPVYVLIWQFISEPLDALDTTHTVDFAFRCYESNAKLDGLLVVQIRKCDADGSNDSDLGTFIQDDTEFDDSGYVNRYHSASRTFAIGQGQRLICEVGFYANNTKTTDYYGGIGATDNSGTDLPENDTETAAYNSWIEFSGDFSEESGNTYNEEITLAHSAGDSRGISVDMVGAISLVASAGDSCGGQADFVGALTLLASGGLSMQGALEILSTLSLSSSAGISQAGGLSLEDALTVAAAAGITPVGATVIERAISIVAAAGLTPTSNNVMSVARVLAASAGIVLVASKNVTASLSMAADAGISQAGGLALLESLSMAASAGISESGEITKEVSLVLGVSAQIAVSTIVEMFEALNLPANVGMAYGAALVMGAATVLAANVDMAQEGTLAELFETLTLAMSAGFGISSEMIQEASLTLPASGQMALSAATLMQSTFLMNAMAAFSSAGGLALEGSVSFGAQFGMSQLLGLLINEALTLAIQGDITPAAVKEIEASATLAAAVQQAQSAVWSGNVSIALGILADFSGYGAAKVFLSHKIFEALIRKRSFEVERDHIFDKIRKGKA